MFTVTTQYPQSVRSGGGAQTVKVAAYYNGAPLAGASNLLVKSGSVTDDSTPGVRRTLQLELVSVPGLFDLLSPLGVQVKPISVYRYPDGSTEQVPMGVFEVDSTSLGYGVDGSIKLTGSDRWLRIQEANFLIPTSSVPGVQTLTQISALIRGALGPTEPVNYLVSQVTTDRVVGSFAWDAESGRDEAINALAESIGCWVFFDRNGVATIQELPKVSSVTPPVWIVDAGSNGVLLDASRSADRSKTRNVVVVNSTNVDGSALFDPQIVWDTDVLSPTYAGTDPLTAAGVGPFGIVPTFYSSPLLLDAPQAVQAGYTILARSIGLQASLSLSAVRNHALDALDVIKVVLPAEAGQAQATQTHLVDKVTHPLTPDGAQDIDTRATRTEY